MLKILHNEDGTKTIWKQKFEISEGKNMEAEIITVPKEADSTIVLFLVGLTFRGQEIYLESTGNISRDTSNKEAIYHSWLDAKNKGTL